jgi:hypothetical protein
MLRRAGAAACAAAMAGVLLVPAELNARGAAGHPGGFRPMVRPIHRMHPPFIRPGHRVHPPHHHPAPFAHRHSGPFSHRDEHHGFRAAARRHHRGILTVPLFGYGVPVTYDDDSAFVGTYYDPSDFVRTMVVPAYTVPPAPIAPLAGLPEPPVGRVGCRSETVSVPSPSGAERSVIITRC